MWNIKRKLTLALVVRKKNEITDNFLFNVGQSYCENRKGKNFDKTRIRVRKRERKKRVAHTNMLLPHKSRFCKKNGTNLNSEK